MITEAFLFGWHIAYDREATTVAYQAYHVKYKCNCAGCRNFTLASKTLPYIYYQFLEKLGIDPEKSAEVAEYCRNLDGSHLYSWWFHFVGKVLSGPSEEKTYIDDNIEVLFRKKKYLVMESMPEPIVQVELFTNLPWLLDEPNI
jgi:hypothetical protein